MPDVVNTFYIKSVQNDDPYSYPENPLLFSVLSIEYSVDKGPFKPYSVQNSEEDSFGMSLSRRIPPDIDYNEIDWGEYSLSDYDKMKTVDDGDNLMMSLWEYRHEYEFKITIKETISKKVRKFNVRMATSSEYLKFGELVMEPSYDAYLGINVYDYELASIRFNDMFAMGTAQGITFTTDDTVLEDNYSFIFTELGEHKVQASIGGVTKESTVNVEMLLYIDSFSVPTGAEYSMDRFFYTYDNGHTGKFGNGNTESHTRNGVICITPVEAEIIDGNATIDKDTNTLKIGDRGTFTLRTKFSWGLEGETTFNIY